MFHRQIKSVNFNKKLKSSLLDRVRPNSIVGFKESEKFVKTSLEFFNQCKNL